MRRYWNNKGRIIFNVIFIVFCSTLLALCFILPNKASSGPYLNSAHGDTGYGVKRSATGFPTDYGRGNCVHCHEQHASIGGAEPHPQDGHPSKYLLLSDFVGQTNAPCFDCHIEAGYPQYQDPPDQMYLQYNYSRIAGGDITITCPNNIARAFAFVISTCASSLANNCGSSYGSSHCLANIAASLVNKWGFSSAAANNYPCSGCHNPHRAQRDYSSTGFLWTNGVSSLSRPSQHSKDNNVWQLWGDDASERMSNYTPNYQPPYRVGKTTYEPDGFATSDASRTIDFVALCTDCHYCGPSAYYCGPPSPKLGRQTYNVVWDTALHGKGHETDDPLNVRAPYVEGQSYVLSCLDCHEPHGSPNEFLLRQEVNGTTGIILTVGGWIPFCSACHTNVHAMAGCSGCHNHRRDLSTMF